LYGSKAREVYGPGAGEKWGVRNYDSSPFVSSSYNPARSSHSQAGSAQSSKNCSAPCSEAGRESGGESEGDGESSRAAGAVQVVPVGMGCDCGNAAECAGDAVCMSFLPDVAPGFRAGERL
jgi:hypothetical protein